MKAEPENPSRTGSDSSDNIRVVRGRGRGRGGETESGEVLIV